jgi:cobalt-zinc-cadmium efflux system membrane fusion protein
MALASLTAVSACRRAETETASVPDFQRNGDRVVVPEGSALRRRIQFGTATADSVRRKLSAPAVIEADPEKFARVFPPLAGHLLKLHVQLGDPVTEGQLVATLQSSDFTFAQGDYVKAKSAFALTTKALGREQQLFTAKIAAEKDLEQAQNDFDNTQSDLDAASGRLRSFGFDPARDSFGEPLRVFSPLTGKVVDIASAHHGFHNDPTAALMTVADLSTVWMTASVPEKDIRFLHPGEDIVAVVDAYPDESFRGKVLFIGDLIDPDTRTAKVRIAFANPDDRLKPGMFATVGFLDVPATQVTVPTTAVVQVGSSAFVLVQVAPWQFQSVKVMLGEQVGGRIVILDGVVAGATVVSKEGALFQ